MKPFYLKNIFPFLFVSIVFINCNYPVKPKQHNSSIIGEYPATLTDAPNVPPPITYVQPENVIVHLVVTEKEMHLADGVQYTFWTFGGKVPGKFIRVRQGDEVEIYLSNDSSSTMPHNLDLHAAIGPGGGSEISMTAPGHTSKFTFKALHPGIFIYHCATPPVGEHIANGMYGLILVEPPGGLPKVDKEFYIMQGEVYTKGNYGDTGLQKFDMEKALKEQPDYVIFNGSVGSTTGDKALQAKVGQTVRLFVGNAGPNLVSSFHIIGEVFDSVHVEGGDLVNHNVSTTLIPAGGATMIEFTCTVPGIFTMVDHSMFRTMKGAMAQIKVTGPNDSSVFSGRQQYTVYIPGSNPDETAKTATGAVPERSLEERMKLGATLFTTNCSSCHQPNGQGVPNTFPPLAKSDYFMKLPDKGIGIVLHGLQGNITVNGHNYNGVMPQLMLSNDDIANILTHERNSWGNKGGIVTAAEVTKERGQ